MMAWPIYLYVPNLIGYARIVANIVAFSYAFHNKGLFTSLYLFSFFCDYLDGRFAVWLDQKSTFGAVLDMVTDRLSTAGLLIVLTHLYPSPTAVGALSSLLVLDIASHWLQMYASLLQTKSSHKEVGAGDTAVLRLYYSSRLFMLLCCAGAEFLLLSLYLLHDPSYTTSPAVTTPGGKLALVPLVAAVSLPGWIMKQIINAVQLISAADVCVRYDEQRRKEKSR